MKEFTKQTEETWQASEKWGEVFGDCVGVVRPRSCLPIKITHESQIEERIPDAPDDLKAHVRNEVLANRGLAENEWRDSGGFIWQFRLIDGCMENRITGGAYACDWREFADPLDRPSLGLEGLYAAARKWRDSQWQPVEGAPGYKVRGGSCLAEVMPPSGCVFCVLSEAIRDGSSRVLSEPEPVVLACCKLLGVERVRELAGNEVDTGSGIAALRWNNGRAQIRHDGIDWRNWHWWNDSVNSSHKWQRDAQAWFRANCPSDRFVTESGEVLEFRMRDDGEAQSSCGRTTSRNCSRASTPELQALYRFRDEERAKWRHKWNDCPPGWFDVKKDGRDFAAYPYISSNSDKGEPRWSERALALVPTWKRREVESLYREKNPDWRAKWDPGINGGRVSIYEGESYRVEVNRNGVSLLTSDHETPPHILTQARAKFREKYELKRDEAWAHDQVIKLKFVQDENGARVIVGPSYFWGENSVRHSVAVNKSWGYLITKDEAERLELFDRARRYYYEEHPGKCLCPNGQPLTFELRGSSGVAVNGDGIVRLQAIADVNEFWVEEQKKLRRWTEEQLKKNPESASKEATIVEMNWHADNQPVRGFFGELIGFEKGHNPSTEIVCDDGTRVKVTGLSANIPPIRGKVRITIEPVREVE